METLDLSFSGPFAWLPGGDLEWLSEATVGKEPGIYLWTVLAPEGELVYYLGETGRSFGRRMEEHLQEQLSGRYRLYEPEEFFRGGKRLLWRGVYGPGSETSVRGFVDQLPALVPALIEVVSAMRFHVAPVCCEGRLRRRIEGALARHLRGMPGAIGAFQDEDVQYSTRHPSEEPISVRFEWQQRPLGVPDVLEV